MQKGNFLLHGKRKIFEKFLEKFYSRRQKCYEIAN